MVICMRVNHYQYQTHPQQQFCSDDILIISKQSYRTSKYDLLETESLVTSIFLS